jgi:hypothetical protein
MTAVSSPPEAVETQTCLEMVHDQGLEGERGEATVGSQSRFQNMKGPKPSFLSDLTMGDVGR